MPTAFHRAARRRLAFFYDWLQGFDTRIVEFGCALRLLVLAANVISLDANGRSVAPFLASAIFAFDNNASILWFALGVIGLWQLAALGIETWPKKQGKRERFSQRFFSSILAAACCAFLVFAMAQLHNPWAVVATYALSMVLNIFDAAVLWVKKEDAKDEDVLSDKGAI